MSDQPSLRSRVVSLVISALDQISDALGIDVRLEGSRLTVTADLAGVPGLPRSRGTGRPPKIAVLAGTPVLAGRRPGRSPGSGQKQPAAPLPALLPGATGVSAIGAKIMGLLNDAKNQLGLNIKKLAKFVGIREKSKLQPAINELLQSGKLISVTGGRYRRTDVIVKPGRKPDKPAKANIIPASPGRKPGGPGKPAMEEPPKRKVNEAQLAGLAKARAVRLANRAAAAKAEKKNAGESGGTAKAAKAQPKKPATKKVAPKPAASKRKTMKALPASTSENGQIPRSETRREVAQNAEAKGE